MIVLYDCYGGGDYLSSGEERHTPQRFAIQVINELAQRCGTPLLVQPPQQEADLWRLFGRTLERAAGTLDPGAVLVVAVDAADNAAVAATERGDRGFLAVWCSSRCLIGSQSSSPRAATGSLLWRCPRGDGRTGPVRPGDVRGAPAPVSPGCL